MYFGPDLRSSKRLFLEKKLLDWNESLALLFLFRSFGNSLSFIESSIEKQDPGDKSFELWPPLEGPPMFATVFQSLVGITVALK